MEPEFHVFLSYNSQDRSVVLEIWKALRARELRPWWDVEDLVPGRDWQKELEKIVRTIPAAAVLVGGNGLGPWEVPEMRACLQQFVRRGLPVIPVLLPGAAGQPDLPLFLQAFTWVDLRSGITSSGIDRLVYGITGERPVSLPAEQPGSASSQPAGKIPASALEAAYRKKEELTASRADTRAVDQEILDLRRTLREGGRLQAGDILGDRFRLLEQLGRGGFATIWKAYDRRERGAVAVKVLHGQFSEDRTRLERFFRGARKMADLQHEGIVRILERRIEDGGYHFFVMEYEPGGDLRQAVLARRLAPERIVPLLCEVAAALDFAHQRKVVHRDVKPANILLDAAGRPKLTDFDLVRAVDTTGGTLEGGMLGTFLYTAPEVMRNPQEAGAAADIYSLAMTAVFCLYGADLPVDALRDTERFLSKLNCPARIRAVLQKAAAWEPERRFGSVVDLARALEEGTKVPAKDLPTAKPKERKGGKRSLRDQDTSRDLRGLNREVHSIPKVIPRVSPLLMLKELLGRPLARFYFLRSALLWTFLTLILASILPNRLPTAWSGNHPKPSRTPPVKEPSTVSPTILAPASTVSLPGHLNNATTSAPADLPTPPQASLKPSPQPGEIQQPESSSTPPTGSPTKLAAPDTARIERIEGYVESRPAEAEQRLAETKVQRPVTLLYTAGKGPTFAQPMYDMWADAYKAKTGVDLKYQSIDSSGSFNQEFGFGVTEGPLDPTELDETGLLQFPTAIGGVVPVVNLKGIGAGQLKLSGPVLADIYLGKITKWSDPKIEALNAGIRLPEQAISVVHRSEGCGTTFIFTHYLSEVSEEWRQKVGQDASVAWPTGVGGKGNEGTASYASRIPGAIGYVDYAYAVQNHLAYMQLRNRDGKFARPDARSFQAAADQARWSQASGFYLLLTNQPGAETWPITAASFALIRKNQVKQEDRSEVLKFFDWVYHSGGPIASQLNYVPMSRSVIALVEQIWENFDRSHGDQPQQAVSGLPAEGIVGFEIATSAEPVFAKWAESYKAKAGITLSYHPISDRIVKLDGTAFDFVLTDRPLVSTELKESGLLQFPLVIGGILPMVNLPGIGAGQLRLSGPILADIYLGKITKWNDRKIKSLNAGLSLPDQAISVVHRADVSGTTFLFTHYLSEVSLEWRQKVGEDTSVSWPTGVGGKGNEGVASYTSRIPGAIGYVEHAYAVQNRLTYALLQNRDGKFVRPTAEAFQAAASNAGWALIEMPTSYLPLTNQPGAETWPITTATFVLIHTDQKKKEVGLELLKFLDWVYHNGGPMASQIDWLPIPRSVFSLVERTWKSSVKGPDGTPLWTGQDN